MSDLKLGIVFDVKNGKFKSEVKQNTQAIDTFSVSAEQATTTTKQLDNRLGLANFTLAKKNKVTQAVARGIGMMKTAVKQNAAVVQVFAKETQGAANKVNQLDHNTQRATVKVRTLGASTQKAAGQTRKLSASLAKTNAKITTTNAKITTTNTLAQSLTRSIGGLAAGFGAGFLLKELSNTTQKFQVLRATLETATGSKEKSADAFERLQKFAASTPYSVEESIQAFIKLKNLGLDPTEAALNSYGNTASAMGKSLDQFIEAVADASVSEFERLKEFGIKAKNQGDTIAFTFRKNKTEVANSAAAIEKYLQNLGNNEFGGAMERQAATFDGALSNMGDAWDQFFLKISDDGVGDAMEDVVRGAASSLNFLGQHIEQINTLFSVGLVIATGHAAKAISAKTAATAKDIVAARISTQASILQAKSEYNLAVAYKASAVGSVQNTLADKRLIATRTVLTAVTNKAIFALKAGRASMALLGGPAGVAMLAAFAMYSFANSAGDANGKVQTLSRSIDVALGKHKALAAQALQTDIKERMARLAQLQQKIGDIHAKIAVGFNQKLGLLDKGVISDSIEESKKLGTEIGLLKAKLKSLSSKENKTNNKPELEPKQDPKNLGNDLARVEQGLLDEEGVINASYVRQQIIVDNSLTAKLIRKEKYNALSLQLEAKKDLALKALSDQKLAQEKERAEQKSQADQKTIDDGIQAKLNARNLIDQQRRDTWDLELAELQGYHSLKEAEEAAHNERVMAMKTRKTGDMQGTLMQFANFEKKTQLEKTSAVIGIGEYGFKAMAGQSKKAFAMYKAFSIGQALIKTYEAATSAYSAMASIPYIGPALGVAAAAAAVVSGMAQVKQIKAQKPQGFERGGFIGDNNVIEFGERNKPEVLAFEGRNYLLGGNQGQVFNQQQLNEIDGSGGGAGAFSNQTHITIQGNADESVLLEFVERNSEAIYSAYLAAKNERCEAG